MARLLVTLKLTAVLEIGANQSADYIKELILADAGEDIESNGVAEAFYEVVEEEVMPGLPSDVQLVMRGSDLSVTTC